MVENNNNWFNVDKNGLCQLYADKPKTFIINELVQNAWDEDIKECKVNFSYNLDNNILKITVEDDSAEGFKILEHAYTLFANTYKRQDPTKRGYINIGEKLVMAICNKATVETTKGTIIFDETGRHELNQKRKHGSVITLWLDATLDDYNELIAHSKKLLVPKGIKYIVDGVQQKQKPIYKSFRTKLKTELMKGDILVSRWRETSVNLVQHNDDTSYIYEMGIPIQVTDCSWHIDVQQKVLHNLNRDACAPRYLQDLYAEVLNNVHGDLKEEQTSALWVRTGMKDKNITKEAVSGIMKSRYGDKYCIANPRDVHSMEEAIAKGYNVIYGSELSKEEWEKVKEHTSIQSTSQMFGESGFVNAIGVEPTKQMLVVKALAQKIAKRILNIDINIQFLSAKNATTAADYNRETKTLRFNVGNLSSTFFDNPVSSRVLDLIYHELGHEEESMVEYHKLLTRLGAEGTMLALKEPEFFMVN